MTTMAFPDTTAVRSPGDAESDPRFTTRFCGGMLVGAAALSVVVVVVLGIGSSHNSLAHYTSVLVSAGLAAVGGIAFLLARTPAPARLLYAVPALGVVLLTTPMVLTHGTTPTGVLLLTWPILFAGYLLPRRVAWATLVVVLVAFGFVAATGSVLEPTRAWLELAASANVTLVVVLRLRRQTERLRSELTRQARTDPLTGLDNRRAFSAAMDREYARHQRSGRPLSLISVDIDHFKRINDSLGHATGDATLRSLGALLASQIRPFDAVGRLGGEEFAVLITDCSPEQAHRRAQALVATVRSASAGWEVPITVSAGTATFPDHATTPETLFAIADEAMYQAKQAGRDRVGATAGAVGAHVVAGVTPV